MRKETWAAIGVGLVFLTLFAIQDGNLRDAAVRYAVGVPCGLLMLWFYIKVLEPLDPRNRNATVERSDSQVGGSPANRRSIVRRQAQPRTPLAQAPIPVRWFLEPWYLALTLAAPAALFGTVGYLQGFWPGGLFAGLISGFAGAAGSLAGGLVRRREERRGAAQRAVEDRGSGPPA